MGRHDAQAPSARAVPPMKEPAVRRRPPRHQPRTEDRRPSPSSAAPAVAGPHHVARREGTDSARPRAPRRRHAGRRRRSRCPVRARRRPAAGTATEVDHRAMANAGRSSVRRRTRASAAPKRHAPGPRRARPRCARSRPPAARAAAPAPRSVRPLPRSPADRVSLTASQPAALDGQSGQPDDSSAHAGRRPRGPGCHAVEEVAPAGLPASTQRSGWKRAGILRPLSWTPPSSPPRGTRDRRDRPAPDIPGTPQGLAPFVLARSSRPWGRGHRVVRLEETDARRELPEQLDAFLLPRDEALEHGRRAAMSSALICPASTTWGDRVRELERHPADVPGEPAELGIEDCARFCTSTMKRSTKV